jgi:hypothetical protein
VTDTPLRSGLGGYVARSEQLPTGSLTQHDIGELLRRAGLAVGFVVESEFKGTVRGPGGNRRKIDWVWFAPQDRGRPIAAIEIEGRDVDEGSIDADRAKFGGCGAAVLMLVLFQVDHDLSPKGKPSHGADPVERARTLLGMPEVEVLRDVDLMAPGGIERLQARAREAVAKLAGSPG